MIQLTAITERWETDERCFRRYGQAQIADVLLKCRQDLEESWREQLLDELSLEEAAVYSGWSYDTVQKKIRSGQLPNSGTKGAPRVRRCDLPSRAPGYPCPSAEGSNDLADRISTHGGGPD
jgi:hypothetical protein